MKKLWLVLMFGALGMIIFGSASELPEECPNIFEPVCLYKNHEDKSDYVIGFLMLAQQQAYILIKLYPNRDFVGIEPARPAVNLPYPLFYWKEIKQVSDSLWLGAPTEPSWLSNRFADRSDKSGAYKWNWNKKKYLNDYGADFVAALSPLETRVDFPRYDRDLAKWRNNGCGVKLYSIYKKQFEKVFEQCEKKLAPLMAGGRLKIRCMDQKQAAAALKIFEGVRAELHGQLPSKEAHAFFDELERMLSVRKWPTTGKYFLKYTEQDEAFYSLGGKAASSAGKSEPSIGNPSPFREIIREEESESESDSGSEGDEEGDESEEEEE